MTEPETPQFALPFRLDSNDQPVVVTQDETEEVRSSVEVLLRTPVGSFQANPDLGFEPGVLEEGDLNPDVVSSTIDRWEPRAEESLDLDAADLMRRRQEVLVKIGARDA